MVRRCIVPDCKESDISILSHRFPKVVDTALKWQRALKVQNYTLLDLQKKFVVCTRHFSPSSYRNEISNSLNTTAVPNLGENLDNERIRTTDFAVKKQHQAIARCHKLPQQKFAPQDIDENVKLIEVCETAPKSIKKENKNQIVMETDPVEETFQCIEMEAPEEPEEFFFVDDTESIADDSKTTPQEPTKVFSSQETQTDSLPPPPQDIRTDESKDDKLVKILYPEFQDVNKIKLIELLHEKDRKIEALEEKIKKLEIAMKNLL